MQMIRLLKVCIFIGKMVGDTTHFSSIIVIISVIRKVINIKERLERGGTYGIKEGI